METHFAVVARSSKIGAVRDIGKRCLYCQIVGGWTDEHVLQDGFDTSWVLKDDVCGSCNSHFSALDTKLIDFVRNFAYLGHPDVSPLIRFLNGKLGLMRDPVSGAWHSVRIERGKPVVFPQLVFLSPTKIHFALDADRVAPPGNSANGALGEMRRICCELKTLDRLKLIPVIANVADSQPAIVRSRPYAYMLRGTSRKTISELETAIRSGPLISSVLNSQTDMPVAGQSREPTQLRFSLDLGSISRAIAKTALNFICKTLGPETARSPDYNGLRNFARYDDGPYEQLVRILIGSEAEDAKKVPTFLSRDGHHTMLLLGATKPPAVFLSLYGRPFAVVRLDKAAIPRETIVAAFFDYRRGGRQLIDGRSDPLALIRLFAPHFVAPISTT